MATSTEVSLEEAIAAYEEQVKSSARVNVTEALAVRALFRKYGFTHVKDGVENLNNEKIKEALFDIAVELDHRVGAPAKERTDKPVHRFLVTKGILTDEPVPPPHGDADPWDAQDALAQQVWHKAEQHNWKLVDHKFGGTLQRWLRDDDELGGGLVLVKDGDYLFVTDQVKYVEAGIIKPMTAKAELALIGAGEQLGLFTDQLPALKGRARSILKKAAKEAGEKAQAAYTLRVEANGGDEE